MTKMWFGPKSFGYGAGLPIAWQGWALLLAYIAIMAAAGLMITVPDLLTRIVGGAVTLAATWATLVVIRKRTQGGWRWRWGGR